MQRSIGLSLSVADAQNGTGIHSSVTIALQHLALDAWIVRGDNADISQG